MRLFNYCAIIHEQGKKHAVNSGSSANLVPMLCNLTDIITNSRFTDYYILHCNCTTTISQYLLQTDDLLAIMQNVDPEILQVRYIHG